MMRTKRYVDDQATNPRPIENSGTLELTVFLWECGQRYGWRSQFLHFPPSLRPPPSHRERMPKSVVGVEGRAIKNLSFPLFCHPPSGFPAPSPTVAQSCSSRLL